MFQRGLRASGTLGSVNVLVLGNVQIVISFVVITGYPAALQSAKVFILASGFLLSWKKIIKTAAATKKKRNNA